MTSKKCLTIIVLLFSLWSVAAAQEAARHNVVVQLADGGFVAFKSETAWSRGGSSTAAGSQITLGEFRAPAFVDDNRVIHRVPADAAGKDVFGYDLLIQAVPGSKTFTIAVAPLDSQI